MWDGKSTVFGLGFGFGVLFCLVEGLSLESSHSNILLAPGFWVNYLQIDAQE